MRNTSSPIHDMRGTVSINVAGKTRQLLHHDGRPVLPGDVPPGSTIVVTDTSDNDGPYRLGPLGNRHQRRAKTKQLKREKV